MAEPTAKPKSKESAATKRSVEARWGKVNTEAGWTALPSVIFTRQQALRLEPLDLNIILHLAGAWWDADRMPYPSVETLATAIGVTPRTIQRRIKELESWGYIKRKKRTTSAGRQQSNHYDLTGLVKACQPFSHEHIADRDQRKREAVARSTRKKPKALTVIAGGKT
jgi:DNA-binding transcriptional regulator YhcF (GntR family)